MITSDKIKLRSFFVFVIFKFKVWKTAENAKWIRKPSNNSHEFKIFNFSCWRCRLSTELNRYYFAAGVIWLRKQFFVQKYKDDRHEEPDLDWPVLLRQRRFRIVHELHFQRSGFQHQVQKHHGHVGNQSSRDFPLQRDGGLHGNQPPWHRHITDLRQRCNRFLCWRLRCCHRNPYPTKLPLNLASVVLVLITVPLEMHEHILH